MTGSRLKVAMVEQVCAKGGMVYYDHSLCKGLRNAGVGVKLYTSFVGEGLSEGVEAMESFKGVFGKAPAIVRLLRWMNGLRITMSDAKKNGASLIHLHFFDSGLLEYMGLWSARLWGFKVVATIHNVEPLHTTRAGWSAQRLFSRLDGIVVHNEYSRQKVCDLLPPAFKDIAVIAHGHYLEYVGRPLTREQAREAIGVDNRGPLLLFFGQIRRTKGLDIAIRALATVVKKRPDVRLLVAGAPWKDEMGGYEALIRESGLENHVLLHVGHVPVEKVDSYFYACDAVVMPYRRISTSGLALNAMSYGRPVIASDLPALRELIDDGVNGLLYPEGDVDALARAILRLTDAAGLAEDMGRKGKEFVTANFDWDDIGRKTAAFYEKTLVGGGR